MSSVYSLNMPDYQHSTNRLSDQPAERIQAKIPKARRSVRFLSCQNNRVDTGVPLKPMLAKISEGIPDAIKQLRGAPFLAEYKYDGTRAQIHLLPDNSVKIFSRNCEDKTASMPDVVAAVQAAAKGTL